MSGHKEGVRGKDLNFEIAKKSIYDMDDESLSRINKIVINLIKSKKQIQNARIRGKLQVGDKVFWMDEKEAMPTKLSGTVEKLSNATLIAREYDNLDKEGGLYRLRYSALLFD
jgi:hypothetical protein